MPTNQSYEISSDVWKIAVEWTITAAGAVVPNADGTTTTEPEISVARSGVGTYLLTVPGNFQRAYNLRATYRAAAPSSIVANVTTVGLGTGALQTGGGVTSNFTVTTGNSNAVPAAADQAAGIVGFVGSLIKHKL